MVGGPIIRMLTERRIKSTMSNYNFGIEEQELLNNYFDARDKYEILNKLEINKKILSEQDNLYRIISSLIEKITIMSDEEVNDLILLLPIDEFSPTVDEEKEFNEWYDNKQAYIKKFGITEDDGCIDDFELEMPYSEITDDWM